MAKQELPHPRARPQTRPERVAAAERARSMGVAERIFDVMMMILFAILGAILIVLGAMLSSTLSVIGGVVVLASVVPLWLGAGGPGRRARKLGWYPVAVAMVIIGLVLWVNPWA
ncbi:hypothetical protein [Microlunatus soli]|uniref:Uncharacterized protein n=1 Tax=Microlunatus soli TaxID=630515 RepID=A0A1H1U633_9ACTN|nr:hypothetical protein [Microlunatus soli]SDS67904.1 hypothetical protein SAMN04489812_2653 [Microlunatus soli]